MLQSYLGLASTNGLEIFCPEQPDIIHFLWRRARRRREPVVCFWAVVPDDVAEQIRVALHLSGNHEALDLLQRRCHEWGSLLPAEEDVALLRRESALQ